jgi:hypothetical protein
MQNCEVKMSVHKCHKEDKIDMMYDMIVEIKRDIHMILGLKWKIMLAILSIALGSNLLIRLL